MIGIHTAITLPPTVVESLRRPTIQLNGITPDEQGRHAGEAMFGIVVISTKLAKAAGIPPPAMRAGQCD